jgi:hypothetical protein
MLKKSIHEFFQRILSRRMSAMACANQELMALFALGQDAPKQETLNHSAFPVWGHGRDNLGGRVKACSLVPTFLPPASRMTRSP